MTCMWWSHDLHALLCVHSSSAKPVQSDSGILSCILSNGTLEACPSKRRKEKGTRQKDENNIRDKVNER